MIQPRNTLVVVELIDRPEQKIGDLVIPTNGDLFTEASVAAVGPGTVSAEGGRSETFDLKVGQRVLVKHKDARSGPGGHRTLSDAGQRYVADGKTYMIFEQSSIIGILGDAA